MVLRIHKAGTSFTAFAPAKINLALHVTRRRSDGYHDIDTLVMFAKAGDRLVAEPDVELSLEVSGRFSGQVPQDRENLVFVAAKALRDQTQIKSGARLSLIKELPVGAGIGGGSSDAAAVLAVLNRMWDTGLDIRELIDIGARLGADIPMCLQAETLRAEGTGDVLHCMPGLPSVPLVIVWPARSVPTGTVFQTLTSFNNPPLPYLEIGKVRSVSDLVDFLAETRNDLADAACALEHSIGDVLRAVQARPGCLISRMSGSGSACFGIFPTLAQAETAALTIADEKPDWWVCAATAG